MARVKVLHVNANCMQKGIPGNPDMIKEQKCNSQYSSLYFLELGNDKEMYRMGFLCIFTCLCFRIVRCDFARCLVNALLLSCGPSCSAERPKPRFCAQPIFALLCATQWK